MQIVISTSNGDLMFSGDSVLSTDDSAFEARRETWDDDVANSEEESEERQPPVSGVFPVGNWYLLRGADTETEEEDLLVDLAALAELRPSLFPRNASYDEIADDELSIEDIDRSWDRVAS